MSASLLRRRFITRAHILSLARAKIFTQNGGSGSFPRGGGNEDDGRSLVDAEEECINEDASGDEEKTPRVRVPLRRRVRLVFPTVVVVSSPLDAILALLFSLVVVSTRKSSRRSAREKSSEETARKSERGGRFRPLRKTRRRKRRERRGKESASS